MIENIALMYIAADSSFGIAVGLCFILAGGAVSALLDRDKSEMRSVPFFVFSSTVFFGVLAIKAVWLQVSAAILGGYAWVIVATYLSGLFVAGFCYGRIALARSRDGYGDSRHAVLGFVPLGNLFLMVKPSLTPNSAAKNATISTLRGFGSVLVGILIFVAACWVSDSVQRALEQQQRLQRTDAGALQRQVEISLRLHGLEGTLRNIALGTPVPLKVNETMTLTSLVADGTRLRRTFMLDTGASGLADLKGINTEVLAALAQDLGLQIVEVICSLQQQNAPLLRAGASMEDTYVGSDGTPLVSRTVTREVCGL